MFGIVFAPRIYLFSHPTDMRNYVEYRIMLSRWLLRADAKS